MAIVEGVFIENGDYWNIVHKEVSSLYQRQRIAKELVELVIEKAELFNKKLIAEVFMQKE